jgi:hypothetical protein
VPGIPTLFQALELTVKQLETQGMHSFVSVIKANPGYAYLGALGPAIGDFLPADPPSSGQHPNNYVRIWKTIFFVLADLPASGETPASKGLLSTLITLRDGLNELAMIGSNEDTDALVDFQPKGSALKDAADHLQHLINVLKDRAQSIALWIATDLRPKVNTMAPGDAVPAPTTWQARDFLHWKKTGVFVRHLLDKADATGDARLKAYAYGWIIGYACRVCGSPFVNSIVGGPFRTQWWRQRFVRGYVDAWVHGYYQQDPRPTMSLDSPSPAYEFWPSLCDAQLHKKINLGAGDPVDPAVLLTTIGSRQPFPPLVPADFSQRWFEALQAAYGASIPTGVTAGSLNGAYAMTWMMLWFQTSGAVLGLLGCRPKEPQPPGNCGKDKAELDPFKKKPDGTPAGPPPANIDEDFDEAAYICAIIMSILGFLPTPSGVIWDIISDEVKTGAVDWDNVRCKVYWNREYLHNAIAGLKKLVALTGFGYPDPQVLHEDKQVSDVMGGATPLESARSLAKSRVRSEFPSKPWITITADELDAINNGTDPIKAALALGRIQDEFNKNPDASKPGFEKGGTMSFPIAVYPSFFMDDPANPLTNGDLTTQRGDLYRPRGQEGPPGPFGNAVAAAVDLFVHIRDGFPNWNLDADRGLAWYTWQFKGNKYDPNNVEAEKES